MPLAKSIAVFMLIVMGGAHAQPNLAPGTGGTLPGVPNMAGFKALKEGPPLTAEGVESFIACMNDLRARYGEAGPANDPEGAQAILAEHGFEDMSQWMRTAMQVSMGFATAQTPPEERAKKRREYEQSIEQMRASDMPEQQKQAMLQMMQSMAFVFEADDEARIVGPYMDQLRPIIEEQRRRHRNTPMPKSPD